MNFSESKDRISFAVRVKVAGKEIDYLVEIDSNGMVTGAHATVFKLPLKAQYLFIGKDSDEIIRKVKAYQGLFKFIIPLMLADRLPSFKPEFASIIDEIRNHIGAAAEIGNHSFLRFRSSIKEVEAFEESINKKLWFEIEKLLTDLEERKSVNHLRQIIKIERGCVIELFPYIIPFFIHNAQRRIFELIGEARLVQFRQFLIEELKASFCDPYASGIIHAITEIGYGEEWVYKSLTEYYDQSKKPTHGSLARICTGLKPFHLPRSIEIGFEVLDMENSFSAKFACDLLVHLGNEKEVAKIVMFLLKKDDLDKMQTAFSMAETLSSALLPSAEEMLNIYVKALQIARNTSLITSMVIIAKKTGAIYLYDQIYELLYHTHKNVKYGVIELISRVVKVENIEIYFSEKFLRRYIEITGEPNNKSNEQIIDLIAWIGNDTLEIRYINVLLRIMEILKKNQHLKFRIMIQINRMLLQMKYQPQIETLYLEALEQDEERIKLLALDAFRLSPQLFFKRKFHVYKNDPSEKVRVAASKIMEPVLPYDYIWSQDSDGKLNLTLKEKKKGFWQRVIVFFGFS